MEGDITMICVDTSIINPCWFHDQVHAAEIYCQRKLLAHPDNLVGIVTSSPLDSGSWLAPTHSVASVTISLNDLEASHKDYTEDLLPGFEGWFGEKDMKKRIVVFSGSLLLSTTGLLPIAIARSLKMRGVVLDVVYFGPRIKDREDSKAKDLMALVEAMNDNNHESEESHYFLIEDDGFSLSRHISSSPILPPLVGYKEESPISHTRMESNLHRLSMEGEVTMICVDTSITKLSRFHDQIRAVKIYCERKLKANPNNFVSIVRFGQQDLGICIPPTNYLEKVTYKLDALKPLEQEYTDLLEGFELSRGGWFGLEEMKKRIAVFCGCPILFTMDQLLALLLKEIRVALDVVDFDSRPVKDKDNCRANNLKELVDAINHNNGNEDSHYLLIKDDRFSLSHHISNSSIFPPRVAEEKEDEENEGEDDEEDDDEDEDEEPVDSGVGGWD